MIHHLAATSLVAALLVGPAWAQSPRPAAPAANPAQAAPETADPEALNLADRNFVKAAAAAGVAEVEFGKLAQQKAGSDAVKAFGRRMVEDHTKANERLAAVVEPHDVKLPKKLDPEHERIRERLEQASGAAFDRAYMQSQVADHQDAAQLLEHEINAGQNAALKRFASETLPTIFQHLQMAQDIQAQMSSRESAAAKPR